MHALHNTYQLGQSYIDSKVTKTQKLSAMRFQVRHGDLPFSFCKEDPEGFLQQVDSESATLVHGPGGGRPVEISSLDVGHFVHA